MLEPEVIVAMGRHPALQVQTPAGEAPALDDDGAARLAVTHRDLCGNRVRFVLDIENRVLVHVTHAGVQRLRGASNEQVRPAGEIRVKALGLAIVERQHVVFCGFDQEELLQLLQLLRVLLREVACLRPVVWSACARSIRR